ncbi:hypothetical protein KI387_000420 [Taxus chinensis]|uniref:Uncharacterized protein n=1 Tax=Taxus chinensis TaxID=29808 RepID=A0AA38LP20_TAXCH|nr:hypothetical protein KI387_000420 [Taxus chinensis]
MVYNYEFERSKQAIKNMVASDPGPVMAAINERREKSCFESVKSNGRTTRPSFQRKRPDQVSGDNGVSVCSRLPAIHNFDVGIEPCRRHGGLFLQHVGIFGGRAAGGGFDEKCDGTYIYLSKDSEMDSRK